MDIRTKVTAVLTAGILAAAPIVAFALPNYTLNGNYIITGTLQVNTLAPGGCVTASAAGKLSTTGAACGGGGGGVSSVTSVDPNNNLTAIPTTGAVVLNYSNDPTYTGIVSAETFASSGEGPDLFTWPDFSSNTVHEMESASLHAASIEARVVGIKDNTTGVLALDQSGNLGILGTYYSAALGSSVGDCLEIGTSGSIVSTGSACSGGGAVTSVTGTANEITTVPTTGAVVVSIPSNSILPGTTTANTFIQNPSNVTGAIAQWTSSDTGNTINTFSTGFSVSSIFDDDFSVVDVTNNHRALALDDNGNLGLLGSVYSAPLAASVGDCLEAAANGQIVSSGAACSGGGGGVTSVTAGPSGNLTFAPTTGAVVGDIVPNPNFADSVTSGGGSGYAFYSSALDFPTSYLANNSATADGNSVLGPDPSVTVAGVLGTIWAFQSYIGSIPNKSLATMDVAGDFGTAGYLAAGNLTPGNCLEATTNGEIIDTGSACGGGGGAVSSVTAGPNGNITVAPTTGAVIVDEITNPTFVNVTDSSLTPGDCVQAGTGGLLTTTGSACGSGGGGGTVTSVTSANSLISVANPTTTPVLTANEAPTFTGALSAASLKGTGLAVGNCVQTTTGGLLTTTGSACGSGSGTSSPNLCVQTTAGGALGTPNAPCAVLNLTYNNAAITALGTTMALPLIVTPALANNTTITATDGTHVVSGLVTSSGGGFVDITVLMEPNSFGTTLSSGASVYAGSPNIANGVLANGSCVQAVGNGQITTTGSACGTGNGTVTSVTGTTGITQTGTAAAPILAVTHPSQNGNQSITAVASACTAGTPVTFSPAFSTTPNIVGSTGPIVGDTFAPTAITTTGFTPEVCSVASAATVTVYWIAQN